MFYHMQMSCELTHDIHVDDKYETFMKNHIFNVSRVIFILRLVNVERIEPFFIPN